MTFKDLAKWNTRVSILYAVGVWSMVGSYAYYRYHGYFDENTVKKEEEETTVPVNPREKVYETAHTKTIIVYKEDFVPYSTRIYNFIKSFSGEPGTGDK
ncbi:small integral membrane protein 26-like [Myripristis murdjan]|uniref:small integral membrane protein 26-like n=1 Tax=Myripristis murdjan TaxID=586833 RepID=UPI0011763A2C|nr:small integral membrane protein 26 [Myripristis murdjan]